jgi:hypothetical protein
MTKIIDKIMLFSYTIIFKYVLLNIASTEQIMLYRKKTKSSSTLNKNIIRKKNLEQTYNIKWYFLQNYSNIWIYIKIICLLTFLLSNLEQKILLKKKVNYSKTSEQKNRFKTKHFIN